MSTNKRFLVLLIPLALFAVTSGHLVYRFYHTPPLIDPIAEERDQLIDAYARCAAANTRRLATIYSTEADILAQQAIDLCKEHDDRYLEFLKTKKMINGNKPLPAQSVDAVIAHARKALFDLSRKLVAQVRVKETN